MCMVRSPLFSGMVEALCLEDPVCDLIIGNIVGVRPIQLCPSHRESELWSEKSMSEKMFDSRYIMILLCRSLSHVSHLL